MKFKPGDRVKYVMCPGSFDGFKDARGVVTGYDIDGDVRWTADRDINTGWRQDRKWSSPPENLVLDGPNENTLGNFPKKEARNG